MNVRISAQFAVCYVQQCVRLSAHPSTHRLYPQFAPQLKQTILLNSAQSRVYALLSEAYVLQLWKLIYELLPENAPSVSPPSNT